MFAICITLITIWCRLNSNIKNSNDQSLNTIDSILLRADSLYATHHESRFDSIYYLHDLNEVFLQKFHHEFAQYTFADNYILYFFCMLTNHSHRGVVIPHHLALYDKGICSQQAILLIETAIQKGYRARPVRLNKHFVCEVFAYGQWHMLDPNLKLSFANPIFISSAQAYKNDILLRNNLYINHIKYSDKVLANTFFDTIEAGAENKFAAPNLKLLHEVSFFLSDYLWAFCWLLCAWLYKNNLTPLVQKRSTKNLHPSKV